MIKKLFTLFICTLSLAATFTSCGDEAIDVESVNKQTIFVFFPWTGDTRRTGLYSDLKNNVDSMCEGIVAKKGLNNSRVTAGSSPVTGSSKIKRLSVAQSALAISTRCC